MEQIMNYQGEDRCSLGRVGLVDSSQDTACGPDR